MNADSCRACSCVRFLFLGIGEHMKNELGEIILVRKLEHREGKNVFLLIGRPVASEDNSDYECPFKFVGLGRERIRWTFGIDSVQALHLCIQRASALFEQQEDVKKGVVTWHGGRTFGF